MKKSKLLLMLISLLMVFMLTLTACGGGSGSSGAGDPAAEETSEETSDDAAAEAETSETDFLLGTWFAKECTQGDLTADPKDVFGGTFYLWFGDGGDCQICIDQKRAAVTWEYTGDGVTLTGDNTYQITFPDDSRKTMVMTINDFETLLEKHES